MCDDITTDETKNKIFDEIKKWKKLGNDRVDVLITTPLRQGMSVANLLVAAWAVLLVVTRRTIRKESDVHRFMNTRCLGAMPQIRVKRRSKEVHKRLMLTESQVEEAFQESLHIIRNKIEQHFKRYNNKTFLFTSALAGEEKSTIAVNFALSLEQAGLLTDAVVLAQYADAAAIVVRKNFARVDSIMDGMEHLAESKIQIAGGIINGV